MVENLHSWFVKPGAHRVRRMRKHVTPHAHSIIQTWWTFLKIVYSLYSINYDVRSRNVVLSVHKHEHLDIDWWKESYREERSMKRLDWHSERAKCLKTATKRPCIGYCHADITLAYYISLCSAEYLWKISKESSLNTCCCYNNKTTVSDNEHARYVFILIWLLFKLLWINCCAIFELCCSQSYMLLRPSDSLSSWSNIVSSNLPFGLLTETILHHP